MQRKLIKQGGGGYTVYLPKKWIEEKKLKQGNKINILEIGNNLIINAKTQKKRETTITLNEKNIEELKLILTHLYRDGFDKINLKKIPKNYFKIIKEIVEKLLLGFEISEQEQDSCVLESISEPEESKYSAIMKRNFLIIKETIKNLKQENMHQKDQYEKTIDLKYQHDKFILFCRRLIVKKNTNENPLFQWDLLISLMHIEHTLYYLHKYAFEKKIKFTKNNIQELEELENYFTLLHDAKFKKDITQIYKINALKRELHFGRHIEQLVKNKEENKVILAYLKEVFRLVQIATSPILSELLEEEFIKKQIY